MEVDNISEDKTVIVKSKDGKEFHAKFSQLKMSGTLREMIESLGESEVNEIPLTTIDSIILEKILKWTDQYKNTEQPTAEQIKNKRADSISQWDEEFLKMPLRDLYELIKACNYLNIPGLIWLCTRHVAYMIKGKDTEEIRQLFNIENDWDPEELERVQRENSFCEEYRE